MENLQFGELEIAEEKGLQDVKVFWLCECDAVAAYSLDEARTYYKNLTGLSDEELYTDEEVEIEKMDANIRETEDEDSKMITVQEIVNRYWEGEPFIAITTGY